MSKKADRRLYYNADKSELVEEGDPRASFLAAGVGDEIPHGLTAPAAQDADEAQAEQPDEAGDAQRADRADSEAKQASQAPNKAVKAPGNK